MIVLTGGAGFIGSCFLKKLNENNIRNVLVVDSLGKSEKWKNLVGKSFISFMNKEEFIEKLDWEDFGEPIEAVFHFGACTDTTERDADYMISNNLDYSKILGIYCSLRNIRMIYASSAATYGMGENSFSDRCFYELRPLNIYGFSKHLFDLWVIEQGLANKFTGLKFFNVYGPNEYHKDQMASMVYKAFKQVKDSGKIRLFKSNHPDYKDGEQLRDFIYVKDVVEVVWQIYQRPEISGIYNLGTGEPRSWNDLARAVFGTMGESVKIEYVDMPEELSDQYQNYTCADLSKLREVGINYNFTSLEDGVKDYIQNYLLQKWQYI